MEAADDIAYCLSDIEDGIERGLVEPRDFAKHVRARIKSLGAPSDDTQNIVKALDEVADSGTGPTAAQPKRLAFMQDLRSAVIRLFAHNAGASFRAQHTKILAGEALPLLGDGKDASVLGVLKKFADTALYRSNIVRSREVTAHAVIFGLLDAYRPLMDCTQARFEGAIDGIRRDENGGLMVQESGLIARLPPKYLAVYREFLRREGTGGGPEGGERKVTERILRMRVIVDHISGMTDAHALRSLRLFTGVEVDHL
jgi:dGTPase